MFDNLLRESLDKTRRKRNKTSPWKRLVRYTSSAAVYCCTMHYSSMFTLVRLRPAQMEGATGRPV